MSLSLAARRLVAKGYRAGLALEKLSATQPRDPDVDAAANRALSEMWWFADEQVPLEVTHLLNLLEARREGRPYAKPLLLSGVTKVLEQIQKQVIAVVGRRETDRVEALLILLYVAQVDGGRTLVPTPELAGWLGIEPEEVEEMLRSARLDGLAVLNRGGSGASARITFDGRAQVDEWLHDDAPPTVEAVRPVELVASASSDGAIEELELTDIFSFGPKPTSIPLGKLNLLIGANGSGKTNVLDAIELLAATAGDLRGAVIDAGGIGNILFKEARATNARARLSARIRLAGREERLRHEIALGIGAGQSFEVVDERIENADAQARVKPFFFFAREPRGPMLSVRRGSSRRLEPAPVPATASVLGEPAHHVGVPELVNLVAFYSAIRPAGAPLLDRHDRRSLRWPSPADARNDRLTRDATNLAMVLSRIQAQEGTTAAQIAAGLREVLAEATHVGTSVAAGTVELFVEEEGGRQVSALRLSDGTLRFLCLLVLLCDPAPPPLILIEEPELGLHPDAIGVVADLLRDASERCQIIVTTHSVGLVDRFGDTPDVVHVVEKEEGSTKVYRQDPEPLRKWLEKFSLGRLWRMGELGGNRW